ncbi:MAG: DNA polymerase [Patescibacteria group bacterium]
MATKTPKLPTIEQLDKQLAPVLRDMEARGITLDVPYLKTLATEFQANIDVLQADIYREAGHEFSIKSPSQLAVVLYDELKLGAGEEMWIKKTKSHRSTAASELAKFVDTHPIVPLIIKYREETKLLSTYIVPLPELVAEDGRLHTTYSIDTAAGRLSSKNPNLQNIPVRSDEGKKIRRAFVAQPGFELLSIDYSQIELRIAAHFSGDPGLIQAFTEGRDIHAATGEQMGVDRRVAKAINFGLLFGQGAFGLAGALNIPIEDAQAFIDQYFVTFPKLAEWMKSVQQKAHDNGYAETLLGRKRYLAELKGFNANLRNFAERVAINHPIQGTEAEIVGLAMIAIHKAIPLDQAAMLLQVHDELLFEIPEGTATTIAPKLQQIMDSVIELSVPIKTEAEHGPNWEEMEGL